MSGGGMDNAKAPVCPSGDFGCPYWTEDGRCALDDPAHECDDYMFYAGVDEE